MNPANTAARDYYLLPRLEMHEAALRLCEYNGLSFDAYRFETLDALFELAAHVRLKEAV